MSDIIRILLVDDHLVVREGIKGMLAGQPDLEVVGEAQDGATAVELARRLAPDVVLMDLRMPGIDGLEVCRRIRAAEARDNLPRIPVVALTANAYPEHREACLAVGMDGFVTKPLDRGRLLRALDDIAKTPQIAA